MHDFKCVLKRIAVRMMSLKPIFAVKNTPLTPLKGGITTHAQPFQIRAKKLLSTNLPA